MSMEFRRKLPIPKDVKELYPVSEEAAAIKAERDKEIEAVLTGNSPKKLLVIGPCSADREDSVFEYCERLRSAAEKVRDRLIIIPRIYTNKPRTTGLGYKGMLSQPDPNGEPDPFRGILATRSLHTKVLTQLGLSAADELLSPADYRYVSDLLSYVAVGARSVENQEHRLVASGLSVPVGMKNPTGGNLSVMMNAIAASRLSHVIIYRGWDVKTSGNPLTHAILRGYVNKHGENIPNYHYEDLELLCGLFEKEKLANPSFLVDANHANSDKKYYEQPRIIKEVISSMHHNDEIGRLCKGFIVESYLYDGAQEIGDNEVPGISITDPCLGWEKSEKLIYEIADMI